MGQRFKTAHLVLISKPVRDLGRIGFTVAKTVGKAHTRNLVKRRLRHIVREHAFMIENRDLILLALPEAANASFQDLQKDVERGYENIKNRSR